MASVSSPLAKESLRLDNSPQSISYLLLGYCTNLILHVIFSICYLVSGTKHTIFFLFFFYIWPLLLSMDWILTIQLLGFQLVLNHTWFVLGLVIIS